MHPALRFQSILACIFDHFHAPLLDDVDAVDRKSCLAAALTCKAFTDPAMDVAWRSLPGILPILELIPHIKWTDSPMIGSKWTAQLYLETPLTPSDIQRVRSYADRVHTLFLPYYSHVVENDLFAPIDPTVFIHLMSCLGSGQGQSLFPNMHTLKIRVRVDDWDKMIIKSSPFLATSLFLTPGLKNLHFLPQNVRPPPPLTSSSSLTGVVFDVDVMGHLGSQSALGLRDQTTSKRTTLTSTVSVHSPSLWMFLHAITSTSSSSPSNTLRSLRICFGLTKSIISSLGSLSKLEDLVLGDEMTVVDGVVLREMCVKLGALRSLEVRFAVGGGGTSGEVDYDGKGDGEGGGPSRGDGEEGGKGMRDDDGEGGSADIHESESLDEAGWASSQTHEEALKKNIATDYSFYNLTSLVLHSDLRSAHALFKSFGFPALRKLQFNHSDIHSYTTGISSNGDDIDKGASASVTTVSTDSVNADQDSADTVSPTTPTKASFGPSTKSDSNSDSMLMSWKALFKNLGDRVHTLTSLELGSTSTLQRNRGVSNNINMNANNTVCIPFTALEHLSHLPLTTLSILDPPLVSQTQTFNVDVDSQTINKPLSNEEFERVAEWWPRLEVLRIGGAGDSASSRDGGDMRLDYEVLHTVRDSLRHLKSLSLSVDLSGALDARPQNRPRSSTTTTSTLQASHQPLRYLHLQVPHIQAGTASAAHKLGVRKVLVIAQCLDGLFPNLVDVRCGNDLGGLMLEVGMGGVERGCDGVERGMDGLGGVDRGSDLEYNGPNGLEKDVCEMVMGLKDARGRTRL